MFNETVTVVLKRITQQLRDIEDNIDRKSKKLEDVQQPGGTMITMQLPVERCIGQMG